MNKPLPTSGQVVAWLLEKKMHNLTELNAMAGLPPYTLSNMTRRGIPKKHIPKLVETLRKLDFPY